MSQLVPQSIQDGEIVIVATTAGVGNPNAPVKTFLEKVKAVDASTRPFLEEREMAISELEDGKCGMYLSQSLVSSHDWEYMMKNTFMR